MRFQSGTPAALAGLNNNNQDPLTPTPLLVVSWEHHLLVLARLDQIEKELTLVKRSQAEWVCTKEAKLITGIKSCAALKRQRELLDSLIIFRFEGISGKTPMYLRASLVAYCDSKILKPVQPGRNLANMVFEVPRPLTPPTLVTRRKRKADRT